MSTLLEKTAAAATLAFAASAGAAQEAPVSPKGPQTFRAQALDNNLAITVTEGGNVVINQRRPDGKNVDAGATCETFSKNVLSTMHSLAATGALIAVTTMNVTASDSKAEVQKMKTGLATFADLLENAVTACNNVTPTLSPAAYSEFINNTRALKTALTPAP